MNKGIQDTSTNHGGSFLMGLIAGGAIGAGLAIYFAPRLASELRHRVTDSATSLRNAAFECVDAVANRVADVADEVTRRGQAARDDLADVVARGAYEVGRGARDVVRSAREVEQFAMESKTDHRATRS